MSKNHHRKPAADPRHFRASPLVVSDELAAIISRWSVDLRGNVMVLQRVPRPFRTKVGSR